MLSLNLGGRGLVLPQLDVPDSSWEPLHTGRSGRGGGLEGGVEKRVGGGMRGRIVVEMKNKIFKKDKQTICFRFPFYNTTYYVTSLVKHSHRLFGKKTFLTAC